MAKLRLSITMSLDGYVGGPDQSQENPLGVGGMELHQWLFPLREFRDMHGEGGGEVNASSAVVEDRRASIGGLRFVRRIFNAPALKPYVGEEKLPGSQVQTDDELLDYAKRNGNTVYHASCTCMMGPQANCVVDDELRVHGLEGLRVIDASVMPAVTSTNTNAPTIMIAEKAAAMMLEETG